MERQNPLEKLMHKYCKLYDAIEKDTINISATAKNADNYRQEDEFTGYMEAIGKLALKGNVILETETFAELYMYTKEKLMIVSTLTNTTLLRDPKIKQKAKLELVHLISALEATNGTKECLEATALKS